MTEHIKECKDLNDANELIDTGNYRFLEYDSFRGYILVRRKKTEVIK